MSHRLAAHAAGDRDRGFALIALMGAIGAACLGLLLVTERFLPDPAERRLRVDRDLEVAQRLVAGQFLRSGAFPSRITGVQGCGGVAIDDTWSYDPYGRGARLRYARTVAKVEFTSRGPDLRLGTADDRNATVDVETLLRVRQRLRLRLVRAVHVQALAAAIAASGAPTTASAEAVAAVGDCALARRRWWTASPAERVVLQAVMDEAATRLSSLLAATDYVAPVTVTGAGGFMGRLGLGDARARDGAGRRYQLHPVLGVIAVGNDRTGGTDDDM